MKAERAKKERKKERKRKKMDNFVPPSMAFVLKGIEGERMEWERNILLLVRFVQGFEKNNNNSHLSFVYIYIIRNNFNSSPCHSLKYKRTKPTSNGSRSSTGAAVPGKPTTLHANALSFSTRPSTTPQNIG